MEETYYQEHVLDCDTFFTFLEAQKGSHAPAGKHSQFPLVG